MRCIQVVLIALVAGAQAFVPPIAPLRAAPTEKFTVTAGFRDWGPTTIAGATILGGNSSNRGGLFAVDTTSGEVRWTARPTGTAHGSPFVATAPAVSGEVVLAPVGNTLLALSLTTGKELWRGPATAQGAAVVADSGAAYVLGADGAFRAVEAATGREKWKKAFATSGACPSRPTARGGVVYVSGNVLVSPADANRPASYYRYLFALDATTGEERWRYPATPVARSSGVCFSHSAVSTDTFFGASESTLYAVSLETGRDRWKAVDLRSAVFGLVAAGSAVVASTRTALIGIDKRSSAVAWRVAGQYPENAPSLAVADGVLYFQGHPGAAPADEVQGRIVYSGGKPVPAVPALPPGTLHALDLESRAILWSFSRPTAEPNWPFGFVTPVDGGLWVDSYQALVKLQ